MVQQAHSCTPFNFAIHGLIVSDNGTAFTSSEFNDFVQKNGIRHIKSPPNHPASNGLAKRAVQTFKEGLKKSSKGDLETQLTRFLFQYRITLHSTTGITPAELLAGRKPKARLNLLKPNVDARVEDIQVKQKFKHDQHAKDRCFHVGENVFIRIHGTGGTTWRSGKISQHGQTMYKVEWPDGKVTCRHIESDDICMRLVSVFIHQLFIYCCAALLMHYHLQSKLLYCAFHILECSGAIFTCI